MKKTSKIVVGGLAAGGLVVALAGPASAGDWCDEGDDAYYEVEYEPEYDYETDYEYEFDGYAGHYDYDYEATNVNYHDNDVVDVDLLTG